MIYDELINIERYRGISEYLDKAVDFLLSADLEALSLGRHEIFEDKVFANVMEAEAKAEQDVNFEIHKKYMDIQLDLVGTEIIQIGLGDRKTKDSFDEKIDFGTVECSKAAACVMGPGRFIICMKEEPHKPGIASGTQTHLKKCVIKVAADVKKGAVE